MASLESLYRQLVDGVWNLDDPTVVQRLIDPAYKAHDPTMRRESGPVGFSRVVAIFREGFPDLRFIIEETVEQGDKLAVRFTLHGTHRGVFVGIEGTGKVIAIRGMVLAHFRAGRLVEEWVNWDSLGLIRQLGGGYAPER
jgi:predicted ester cyclase